MLRLLCNAAITSKCSSFAVPISFSGGQPPSPPIQAPPLRCRSVVPHRITPNAIRDGYRLSDKSLKASRARNFSCPKNNLALPLSVRKTSELYSYLSEKVSKTNQKRDRSCPTILEL
ncbi:MAG: hypothetical protein QNJ54_34330 [Prochloraceae cyanobacterium]|nr:hypothetical protein [Prochloraceae cyanobacterium]